MIPNLMLSNFHNLPLLFRDISRLSTCKRQQPEPKLVSMHMTRSFRKVTTTPLNMAY